MDTIGQIISALEQKLKAEYGIPFSVELRARMSNGSAIQLSRLTEIVDDIAAQTSCNFGTTHGTWTSEMMKNTTPEELYNNNVPCDAVVIDRSRLNGDLFFNVMIFSKKHPDDSPLGSDWTYWKPSK